MGAREHNPRRVPNRSGQEARRCSWPKSPLMIAYHDQEWGTPVHDDARLFEALALSSAQAGLNWAIILAKRENYRRAFSRFEPRLIARYDKRKLAQLLRNAGIVRNRLKIVSTINNARALCAFRRNSDLSTAMSGALSTDGPSSTTGGACARSRHARVKLTH